MAQHRKLSTGTPWIELKATQSDWKNADPDLLARMFGQLHLIRAFEESVLDLAGAGLLHGPAHSSIGQEAGAVGSIISLRDTDTVNGSHRGHHQFLSKVITYVAGDKLNLSHLVDSDLQDVLHRTLSEIMGLADGFSGGRGGSMHLQWLEAGALGTNAIVGGGVPLAGGSAWASQYSRSDDVTISYFGDGSSQIGSVLESMNLAATWQVPLMFFIENNLYAVSTHASEASRDPRFSMRGQGFSIPSWRVDGMDPLAVHLATQEALDVMRSGGGPTLIETETYRFFHQNGPFRGSAFGYRTKEEEAAWNERDPLTFLAKKMSDLGYLSDEEATSVREQAVGSMKEATAKILENDPDREGHQRIIPALWPKPEVVDTGIRSDGAELESLTTLEPAEYEGSWRKVKYVEAVSQTMERRMSLDDRIVVLGEDVHRLGGGTNGATKGLDKFGPSRLVGTPISENAFFGFATGAALDGRIRPIVEFMYPDFMWVAADQVFNQAGKVRHMFGNNNTVPLVLRTKVAMGMGYGSQHLMDPAGIFATQPGWRIVAASTAADYVGLMNAALALEDPVLVIEHTDLYGKADEVPEGDLDYIIPPASARVRREGEDLTVLTYLTMVDHSLEAVEEVGIDAEVIDLRWLDQASIDWDTIGKSIKKTNAVLIVEQGARLNGYGAWLADEIQRRFFDWLDAPIGRVTGGDASPSISKVLERAAIAKTEEVVTGLENMETEIGGRA